MTESVYMSGFASFSVPENASLIEQSVYKLRNAIMRGDLSPGQKLVENNLCKSLEISRASLREALRVLEAEKLIELVPNRGPSVAKLSANDIEQIHEVWALLTGRSVADFTRNAKDSDIRDLDEVFEQLANHTENNTPLGQLAAVNAFFGTVLERCGNTILAEMVISLVSRVNFLRAQALLHQGWGGLYAIEIKSILERIRARDADGAAEATRAHIATACAAAKKYAADMSLASFTPNGQSLDRAGSRSQEKAKA